MGLEENLHERPKGARTSIDGVAQHQALSGLGLQLFDPGELLASFRKALWVGKPRVGGSV